MKVFKLNNKSNLQEVEQLSFKLEKNIQDLVEKNTELIHCVMTVKQTLLL